MGEGLTITALRDCGAKVAIFIEQLAQWHHQEWLHLNPGATFEQRLARYQKSLATADLPEIFVAYKGEQLLGSVSLEREDMDTRKFLTPWLASLFVALEQRNKGIASQLIVFMRFVETVNYRRVDVDLMCQKLD